MDINNLKDENVTIKVYARQIPPENQESFLIRDGVKETYPEVIFYGNDHFNSHTTREFDRLNDCFNYVNDYIEDGLKDAEYNCFCDLIEGFLYREKELGKYSHKELNKWKKIFKSYQEDYSFNRDLICECLELMTKNEYSYACIRGCCQSDWQYIYYPIELYNSENIEIEYFNLGTEWCVHPVDEFGEIESPNDIAGYMTYLYETDYDKIKNEIAKETGCESNEVKLYTFDGYNKIIKYKEY